MKNATPSTFTVTLRKGLLIALVILCHTSIGQSNEGVFIDRGVLSSGDDHPTSKDLSYYKIPFIFRMKMMLIETTIDRERGYLVLDTGMEESIFNKKYFRGRSGTAKFSGIHTSVQSMPTKVVKLQLGNLPQRNVLVAYQI